MVYVGVRRPKNWERWLQMGIRILWYSSVAALGVTLSLSETWLGLGIPILIGLTYCLIKSRGQTIGYCPFCGTHIATNAAWAVSCKTCRQRSFVRHGQLLTSPLIQRVTLHTNINRRRMAG